MSHSVVTAAMPAAVFALLAVLLFAGSAHAQTSNIIILDNLGEYGYGQSLFLFGKVAPVDPDSYMIVQISNPRGELCRIQQATPMPSGEFLTEPVLLTGTLCGVQGEYEAKLFYGEHYKTTTFAVTDAAPAQPASIQDVRSTVLDLAQSVSGNQFQQYNATISDAATMSELRSIYVELWGAFTHDGAMIDPHFRSAAEAAIRLANEIMAGDGAEPANRAIKDTVYSAIFDYQIGNTDEAANGLLDALDMIANANPVKPPARQLTYVELEEAAFNLMVKTDTVMSSEVKEELAFIFARGIGPLYADELSAMVDLLSKSRFLDITTKKDASLYNILSLEWKTLRESMSAETEIVQLLESSEHVTTLHGAMLLLRELDRVERFLESTAARSSGMSGIIAPEWDDLERRMMTAGGSADILGMKTDIENMRDIVEISTRLSKSLEISRSLGVSTAQTAEWNKLLDRAESASTAAELLEVVSEFENSMIELRESRSPLTLLKFEYESLKQTAEMQADYENLLLIKRALRAIESEAGLTSSSTDRNEIILSWAAQMAPIIRADLEKTKEKAHKDIMENILTRAKSIENLVDMSSSSNRFKEGFNEFAASIKARLNEARDMVINGELAKADDAVRDLFVEWNTVSMAYSDDTQGDTKYNMDELNRIKYLEELESIEEAVDTFYNADFADNIDEYEEIVEGARESIEFGNFVDANAAIIELGRYLQEHLSPRESTDGSIQVEIGYDIHADMWTIHGAGKHSGGHREQIRVSIHEGSGNVLDRLEFASSRGGEFYTRWEAPVDPGIYVLTMQFRDVSTFRVVYVENEEHTPSDLELGTSYHSRILSELKMLISRFANVDPDLDARYAPAIREVTEAIQNRDPSRADAGLAFLGDAIQRHLPVRDKTVVLEATYDSDTLVVRGAVAKETAFSEELFVDVYGQDGSIISSYIIRDGPDGTFQQVFSIPLQSGIHVIYLTYHDVTVTDVITVR